MKKLLYTDADGTAHATLFGGGNPYGSRLVTVSPDGVVTVHGNVWPSWREVEFTDQAELLATVAGLRTQSP